MPKEQVSVRLGAHLDVSGAVLDGFGSLANMILTQHASSGMGPPALQVESEHSNLPRWRWRMPGLAGIVWIQSMSSVTMKAFWELE